MVYTTWFHTAETGIRKASLSMLGHRFDSEHLHYHMLRKKILVSYVKAQHYNSLNGITMQLGGWTKKNIILYLPLAFVVADVLETADQSVPFAP